MENLHIEKFHGTYYIPRVDFDAETGICWLEGESYIEDTAMFYEPLLEWLKKFLSTTSKPLVFNIKLAYYNTSSSKCLVEILNLLSKYQNSGREIQVNWFYDSESEDSDEEIEEVEDFMIETNLKINLIPYLEKKKDK